MKYFLALMISIFVTVAHAEDESEVRMFDSAFGEYGQMADLRIENFQDKIYSLKDLSDQEKVEAVNQIVNETIVYERDGSLYGKNDYWATPMETIVSGFGDCEDYAILKYHVLKELGVSVDKIKVMYVNARSTAGGVYGHMVMAYYDDESNDPLILNNYADDISKMSSHPEFAEIYAFNDNSKNEIVDQSKSRIYAAIKSINDKKWDSVVKSMISQSS